MSLTLTELRPAPGSKRRFKRVGRGIASGHGKTSNRGHRGQKQRSGYSKRFGFEGGQTPLFRRLPKLHNFDQVTRRKWVEVNVGKLNELTDGSDVNPSSLVEHKILAKPTDSLRILGNGELKIKLTVKAHHVSAGAKAKIENAGGTVELIEPAPRTRAIRGQKVEKAKKSK